MAIISEQSYVADGSQREFQVTGQILSDSHIGVWLVDYSTTPATETRLPTGSYDVLGSTVLLDEAPLDGITVSLILTDNGEGIETAPSELTDISANIDDVIQVNANINEIIAVNANEANINSVVANEVNINSVVANETNININATNIADINTNATNIININTVANQDANITDIATQVVPNMAEILLSDDNATVATTKALEASQSALNASISEANALASENKAYKWSEENEDVEVETGKYSAKHWAFKAEELVTDGVIDDTTVSTIKTYSSDKIEIELLERDTNLNNSISEYQGTMITNTDINTVTTGGRYGIIGSGNTNLPIAGECYMEVLNDGAGRVMQMLYYPTGGHYSRVFSGSWGVWFQHNTKSNVGLSNVDNTSDLDKPISTATKEYVDNNSVTFVDKTSDEDIDGIKTFTESPIVPTPTTDFQTATKKYVDDNAETTWVANDTRAKTALNAGGTAPIYACRAWVNFNGTGTVAIRESGNVSSITDNGTGTYAVNFITAMPDSNYSVIGMSRGTNVQVEHPVSTSNSTTSFPIETIYINNDKFDYDLVTLAVFR